MAPYHTELLQNDVKQILEAKFKGVKTNPKLKDMLGGGVTQSETWSSTEKGANVNFKSMEKAWKKNGLRCNPTSVQDY